MKKTLGILLCDDTDPEWTGTFGSYLDFFRNFFEDHPCLELRSYRVFEGDFPASPEDCDGYMLSGSKCSCYENESWIVELRQWVARAFERGTKIGGVCFGHQLIALALGGKVEKFKGGWGLGFHRFRICDAPTHFDEKRSEVFLGLSCQDQVVELPPEANRFMTSEFVNNAGYFIDSRVMAVQGHPEFDRDFIEYLLDKRLRLGQIEKARHAEVKKTLEIPHDNALLATWFAGFFKG